MPKSRRRIEDREFDCKSQGKDESECNDAQTQGNRAEISVVHCATIVVWLGQGGPS